MRAAVVAALALLALAGCIRSDPNEPLTTYTDPKIGAVTSSEPEPTHPAASAPRASP